MAKGMGFKAAQASIAKKQGIPMENAGAILAAGARKASTAAKRANPNLKHVPGNKEGHTMHTPDYPEHKEHVKIMRAAQKGLDCDRDMD